MGFITKNQVGFELLAIRRIREQDLSNYHSIRRTNIMVKVHNKVVLHYNSYQKQWELVPGKRKKKESALEAVKKGWQKKTNIPIDTEIISLKSLLMIKNPEGEIRYNPIYYLEKEHLSLEEAPHLILWDGKQNIGAIDLIHQQIILPLLSRVDE